MAERTIDVPACTRRGVVATDTPGASPDDGGRFASVDVTSEQDVAAAFHGVREKSAPSTSS